jgi:2-polyprenyl-6-methoxyphenol hydroxylase-like FAD-dependent oxidoreductase
VGGDLVVGADGHRSVVRESLNLTRSFEIRRTGAVRLLIPRRPEDGEPHTTEHWSGRRRVGIAACTETQTYVYMSGSNADPVSSSLPIDIQGWKRAFPRIESFFDRLAGQEASRHPYSYVNARRWSAGRTAIIGDAAHALPPTLGQGAGLSIVNAYGLAEIVNRKTSIPEALKAWERLFRPTSDATQRWALRYDAVTEFWPQWLSAGRSAVIWSFGKSRRLNSRMRVADSFSADLASRQAA